MEELQHSPVDLSKVSRDGSWLTGLSISLVEPRVLLLGSWVSFAFQYPFSRTRPLLQKRRPICSCLPPSLSQRGLDSSVFPPDSTPSWNPLATDKPPWCTPPCCFRIIFWYLLSRSTFLPSRFYFFNYSYLFTSKGFVKQYFCYYLTTTLWL